MISFRRGAVIKDDKNDQIGIGCTSKRTDSKARSNSGCAEVNALYSAKLKAKDCVMYCSHFPCFECAKDIIRHGIKELVYIIDHDKDEDGLRAKKLFDSVGVLYRQSALFIDK